MIQLADEQQGQPSPFAEWERSKCIRPLNFYDGMVEAYLTAALAAVEENVRMSHHPESPQVFMEIADPSDAPRCIPSNYEILELLAKGAAMRYREQHPTSRAAKKVAKLGFRAPLADHAKLILEMFSTDQASKRRSERRNKPPAPEQTLDDDAEPGQQP